MVSNFEFEIASRRYEKRSNPIKYVKTSNMVNQPPKMSKIWPSGSQTDMQN